MPHCHLLLFLTNFKYLLFTGAKNIQNILFSSVKNCKSFRLQLNNFATTKLLAYRILLKGFYCVYCSYSFTNVDKPPITFRTFVIICLKPRLFLHQNAIYNSPGDVFLTHFVNSYNFSIQFFFCGQ